MVDKELYGDSGVDEGLYGEGDIYGNSPSDDFGSHLYDNMEDNADMDYQETDEADDNVETTNTTNVNIASTNENNTESNNNIEKSSQEILSQTLPEAFSLLNKMLDEAKKSSTNIETMYETTNTIKGIIVELNKSVTTFTEIGEIVDHLNKVKMVLNINNQNLEKLITVLNKVASKQENIEAELQDMKYDSNDEVDEVKDETKSSPDIILYITVGLNLLLTLYIGVKIGF